MTARPASLRDRVAPAGRNVIFVNLKIVGFLFVLASAVGLMVRYQGQLLSLSLGSIGNIGTVCAVVALVATIRVSNNGMWSPSMVYVIVFSIFHFGLTSIYAAGLLSERTESEISYWFFDSSTKNAIFLASLGVISAAGGVQAAHAFSRPRNPIEAQLPGTWETAQSTALLIAGAIVVVATVAIWFATVIRAGGISLLFGTYEDYLLRTAPFVGILSFVWFGMGVGLALVSGTGIRSRWKQAALVAFSLFAVIALPLGLRGEVLFPTLTALVIAFRIRQRPSVGITLLGIVVALFVISLLREIRAVGIADLSSSNVSGNFLDGLTELGGTIRSVREVVLWLEWGEGPIRGASYWAPFDRALCAFLGTDRCPSAMQDDRLMNVLIQARVGPIGFSPIAEAYFNFGIIGVIMVMGIIGWIVGRMDQWPATPLHHGILGVILVELLINVRNSFVPVPSHIILGTLFVLFLSRISAGRLRNHEAKPRKIGVLH